MKTWYIPVTWGMCGTVAIKANTLEEAMEKTVSDDTPLPQGEYVDGSLSLTSHEICDVLIMEPKNLSRYMLEVIKYISDETGMEFDYMEEDDDFYIFFFSSNGISKYIEIPRSKISEYRTMELEFKPTAV